MKGLLGIFIFIIVFFSIIVFLIGKFVYRIYRMFHQAKRAAADFTNNMNSTQNGGFNASDYERSGNGRRDYKRTSSKRSGNRTEGETIIDTRDPKIAHRKIFSQKEGEYVKFEEEN